MSRKKHYNNKNDRKLKVAIVGLTSCDGCSVSILDMGLEFIASIDHFELGDFFIIMDEKDKKAFYDVAIIEGAPLTKKNIQALKEIRKRAKYLIGIGACAHFGVIPNIKNYIDKKKAVKYQYPKTYNKVFNPNILPISRFVPVDFIIPGCPPDGRDLIMALNMIRQRIAPKLMENPVCYECQLNGNECVLQKGEPCLGPVIRGGCNAVCLNSKFFCKGCRGVIPGYSTKQLEKKLLKLISQKQLEHIMQIFGIQEEWELDTQNKK
ncbi:MAG: hypothetical protein WCV50_02425 [Patescibacteria group bacterium]|jgi:sulfhydrogenase subunit delta